MSRDEWVEAGARVRADERELVEREQHMNGHYPSCPAYGHPTYSACHCTSIQISLDDLRAKVAAMPDSIGRSGRAAGDLLWRNAVLALFDGTDSR